MKIIDRKVLWEGRFIRTVLITYKDKSGMTQKWEAVGRVNCERVVIIVPVTAEGEIILIRQYRPVLDNYVLELPAGLVELGETSLEAARRELVEETGYYTDELVHATEGVISTGINTETWDVVLARGVREAPGDVLRLYPPDESEDIEVVKIPIDYLHEALERFRARGDFVDLRIFGLIDLCRRK